MSDTIPSLTAPTTEPVQFYPLTNNEVFEKAICYDCEQNKAILLPLPAIGAVLDDPDPEYLCRRPLCKEHAIMHGAKFSGFGEADENDE
jgi:hypothetical protein